MRINSHRERGRERGRGSGGRDRCNRIPWNRLIMMFTELRGPLEPTREGRTDIRVRICFSVSCTLCAGEETQWGNSNVYKSLAVDWILVFIAVDLLANYAGLQPLFASHNFFHIIR